MLTNVMLISLSFASIVIILLLVSLSKGIYRSLCAVDENFKIVTDGMKILNKVSIATSIQVINTIYNDYKLKKIATYVMKNIIREKGYCPIPFACEIKENSSYGNMDLNAIDDRIKLITESHEKVIKEYGVGNFIFLVDVVELPNGELTLTTSKVFTTDFIEDSDSVNAYNSIIRNKDNHKKYVIKSETDKLITLEEFQEDKLGSLSKKSLKYEKYTIRIDSVFETYRELVKNNLELDKDIINRFENNQVYLKAYSIFDRSSTLLYTNNFLEINKIADDLEHLFNSLFKDKLMKYYRDKQELQG